MVPDTDQAAVGKSAIDHPAEGDTSMFSGPPGYAEGLSKDASQKAQSDIQSNGSEIHLESSSTCSCMAYLQDSFQSRDLSNLETLLSS